MTDEPRERPDRAVVDAAAAEMDYRHPEGSFGQSFATAIPCQLRFTSTPRQDTGLFHAMLEDNDYLPVTPKPARRHTSARPHYEGEVCERGHYNRVKVLVFRGEVVRLFPLDGHVPSASELTRLLDAIETGFDATLEHDPISDRDGGDGR